MEVVLYQELLSRQWVVELRAMGRRLHVRRSAPNVLQGTEGFAVNLALFLGCPLVWESRELVCGDCCA